MRTILRLIPMLLLTATPAAAQEGGLLEINSGLMVWTVLIFLLVLGILYRTAFPHILGAVEAREAKIRDLIAEAEKDREEARIALEEQKKELEETRAKVHEMVAEGKTAGEKIREDIVGEARKQADELLARTRRDVRQELERAKSELRVEAVDIAIAAASKLVERNLDEEDNRRLVKEYLADIEGSAAPASAGA